MEDDEKRTKRRKQRRKLIDNEQRSRILDKSVAVLIPDF